MPSVQREALVNIAWLRAEASRIFPGLCILSALEPQATLSSPFRPSVSTYTWPIRGTLSAKVS